MSEAKGAATDVVVVVSATQAVVACASMVVVFVASLYLLPASIRQRPRDDPVHIRARFVSVYASCVVAVWVVWCLTQAPQDGAGPQAGMTQPRPLLQWLGLWQWGVWWGAWLPLLHTMALFLGPTLLLIIEVVVDRVYEARGASGEWGVHRRAKALGWGQVLGPRLSIYRAHGSIEATVRNLIVGPASEELVFRACMVPLLLAGGWSVSRVLWCSPLFFGLAHAHHTIQRVREGLPVLQSVVIGLVQLTYTTLFGWYAAYVFLRTGMLAPCFLVHAYCNAMGLPDLSFLAQPAPPPSTGSGGESCSAGMLVVYRHRWLMLGVYNLGIALFATYMSRSTHIAWQAQQPTPVFWPA